MNKGFTTTIEQSKLLLKAGINPLTADVYYVGEQRWDGNDYELTGNTYLLLRREPGEDEHFHYMMRDFGISMEEDKGMYFMPAWSLAALWDLAAKEHPMSFATTEDTAEEVMNYLVDALT